MKSDLFILGVLVVGCGVFAFTQIMQRAQTRLEPQLLADLTARARGSWTEFLLPLAPTFVAYLLVTRFPRHQAAIAIPAILLSAALLVLQYLAARKRVASLDLPPDFLAERRKANVVLVATLVVGMALVYFGKAR
jgi:hypothetical protein